MRRRTVISILTWDSFVYTKNLLLNLRWALPGRSYEVHILDQGSQAETVEFLKSFVPDNPRFTARLLQENIGFGPGHNFNYRKALEAGPIDYFIAVNSDALFAEPGWADRMVEAMEAEPEAAIGGPYGFELRGPEWVECTPAEMAAGSFDFVTGAVAIMRGTAVERMGLFDEAFAPAYWEDADMAFRYTHYGWKQIHIALPVLHGYLGHIEKVNAAKRHQLAERWGADYQTRNQRLFVTRWRGDGARCRTQDPLSWSDRLYIPKPLAVAV